MTLFHAFRQQLPFLQGLVPHPVAYTSNMRRSTRIGTWPYFPLRGSCSRRR